MENFRLNRNLFWIEVNKVRKSKDNVCQAIKDVNGVVLKKEVEVNNRWKEYFEGARECQE